MYDWVSSQSFQTTSANQHSSEYRPCSLETLATSQNIHSENPSNILAPSQNFSIKQPKHPSNTLPTSQNTQSNSQSTLATPYQPARTPHKQPMHPNNTLPTSQNIQANSQSTLATP